MGSDNLTDLTGNTIDKRASRVGPQERHSARVGLVSIGKRRGLDTDAMTEIMSILGLNSASGARADQEACRDEVIGGYAAE